MTQPQPALPPGLDPVRAGKLGLWLLGIRAQRNASLRVAFPQIRHTTLVWRFANLLTPWRIYQYPGTGRYLAAVLGIAPSYARNLMKPSWRLPAKHARKMAEYLANHASQCEALAHELRDYAQSCERSKIYDKRSLRGRKRSI